MPTPKGGQWYLSKFKHHDKGRHVRPQAGSASELGLVQQSLLKTVGDLRTNHHVYIIRHVLKAAWTFQSQE